jgi:acetyl esterase
MKEPTLTRRTLLAAAVAAPLAKASAAQDSAANPQPANPPRPAPGLPPNLRVPARDSLPPLKWKVDYEQLRQQRLAAVDEETRYINLPLDRRPRPEVMADPNVLSPGIKAFNIDIPGPAGKIPMRIYMPEKTSGSIGLYLHTHGGGWAANSGLVGFDTENSAYARDWQCAVAQPDFRVSWDAKFPAAVDDCFAAYCYILDHASELKINPSKIGIGGGCTGANLATVVSLMARDAGLQKPAIQWLFSGDFDTRNDTETYEEFANYSLPRDIAEAVTRLYLRSREDTYDWRASPLLAPTLKGLSPALVWAGEWEILRDENRMYVDRMRDAGVDVTYIEGPLQPHAGIYARNPKTGLPTKYASETLPKVNAIMRRYIGT